MHPLIYLCMIAIYHVNQHFYNEMYIFFLDQHVMLLLFYHSHFLREHDVHFLQLFQILLFSLLLIFQLPIRLYVHQILIVFSLFLHYYYFVVVVVIIVIYYKYNHQRACFCCNHSEKSSFFLFIFFLILRLRWQLFLTLIFVNLTLYQ